MENEKSLQVWEKPAALQSRVQRMLEIQQNVMKQNIDYGIIPGCTKPTLYKPGAELLMVTFCLADRLIVDDLSGNDMIRYRVTTEIYNQQNGVYLGCGVGEASSDEEKYKWRKIVCEGEWEDTDLDRRREKWYVGWKNKPDYKQKQVRTNISDVANTILKMAKKRSKLDAVLSVLGASRIYSQDIEDMSKELQEMMKDNDKPKSTKPDITQATVPVSEKTKTETEGFGKIESVDTKTGTGKKGVWIRYGIKINGEFYGTFDKKIGEAAELYLKEKTHIGFEFKKDGKYNTITQLWETVTESKEQEPPGETIIPHDVFCKEIKSLAKKAKISDIDKFLQEQLKIEKLDDVTTDKQSTVIDLLNYYNEGLNNK